MGFRILLTVTAVLPGAGCKTAQVLLDIPTDIPFQHSYMITNRKTPFILKTFAQTLRIHPMIDGKLHFAMSTPPIPFQNERDPYNPHAVAYAFVGGRSYRTPPGAPQPFIDELVADLKRTIPAGGTDAFLTIFIHGLGKNYDLAVQLTAGFGRALHAKGAYPGLVVGFSWPSYDAGPSAVTGFYASARDSDATRGTIRDNIRGSRPAFVNLAKFIQRVREALGDEIRLRVSIYARSAGCYMLLLGTQALEQALSEARAQEQVPGWAAGWVNFDNALMVAPDISAYVFQSVDGAPPRAQAIRNLFDRVTVYYSGSDVTLTGSNFSYFEYHDPLFPIRLGLIGPYGYAVQRATPSVIGVDCSRVTIPRERLLKTPLGSIANLLDAFEVHESYERMPAVLTDAAQVMLGQPTDHLRTRMSHTEHPLYWLNPTPAAQPAKTGQVRFLHSDESQPEQQPESQPEQQPESQPEQQEDQPPRALRPRALRPRALPPRPLRHGRSRRRAPCENR